MTHLVSLVLGFGLDLLVGDPHGFPHPVILIGKWISLVERGVRKIFPKTLWEERIAGGVLWCAVASVCYAVPAGILWLCNGIHPWLALGVESIMCWQILATKSLKDESMKVYTALRSGDLEQARYAVSMIVGRDTENLDDKAIARAAVETVAENTSDGIVAPLLYLILGGAPLGFFYKGVNTMDSMVGYVEMPYRNIGLVPAKMDDLMNLIPARISALVMLLGGTLLGMDGKSGWRVFHRDRYNHASPNSAQTESVCAGLLGVQLAGDAWYHGVLHKKKYIGDPVRQIEYEDIPRACRLLYATAVLSMLIFGGIRFLLLRG